VHAGANASEPPRTAANAEVDGNRTRRTGSARPNRFEGGGAHQVPGHLRPGTYRGLDCSAQGRRRPPRVAHPLARVRLVKKLLVLLLVAGAAFFAYKKIQGT
jgi:hypothetical protein